MKKYINQVTSKLSVIKELGKRYEMSSALLDDVEKSLVELSDFRLCVPIIGVFSAGKSSLVNSLLEENVVMTDITPETAVPTEIQYGLKNQYEVCKYDGSDNTVVALSEIEVLDNNVKQINVSLNNEFLKQLSNLKIVDMPGFDSGYEVHNRTILEYIPNALTSVLVVAADEGTIPASVMTFLKELEFSEMPIYLIVTKIDKLPLEQIEQVKAHLEDILRNQAKINLKSITCISNISEDNEKIRTVFKEINDDAHSILQKKYNPILHMYLGQVEAYLNKLIQVPSLNVEQLILEKKSLEDTIQTLNLQMEDEKKRFAEVISSSIEKIYNKVCNDIKGQSSILEDILLKGNNIDDRICFIIRTSILTGIREYLEPEIKKYMDRIIELPAIETIFGDADNWNASIEEECKQINSTLRETLPVITTGVSAWIGTLIAGPIGAALGAVAGEMINLIVKKSARDYEEQKMKEAAKDEVGRIINKICSLSYSYIENAVKGSTGNIEGKIDEMIGIQISMREKELIELENALALSQQEQNEKIEQMKKDLARLKAIY